MIDEVNQEVFEVQNLRLSIHNGEAVDSERLHRRHPEELVQDDLGVGILLQLDDDSHPFGRFRPEVRNASMRLSRTRSAIDSSSFALLTW